MKRKTKKVTILPLDIILCLNAKGLCFHLDALKAHMRSKGVSNAVITNFFHTVMELTLQYPPDMVDEDENNTISNNNKEE